MYRQTKGKGKKLVKIREKDFVVCAPLPVFRTRREHIEYTVVQMVTVLNCILLVVLQ